MPVSPGAELQSILLLSLHERARVLRTALSILQRHVATGALVQGTMMLKARSLVPFGAGPLARLTARPYFTRRHDMQQQLQALATYCEERWVTKIGQGPGFQVRMEAQEGQEVTGRRQETQLNATDEASGVDDQQHHQQRRRERQERPLRLRLRPGARGKAGCQAPLCGAQTHEEGGAAAGSGSALSGA